MAFDQDICGGDDGAKNNANPEFELLESNSKKLEVHLPVLPLEVVNAAREMEKIPTLILDGTFGRGGHTRLFLDEFADCRVIGVDRDQAAIASAHSQFQKELTAGRLRIVHQSFSDYAKSTQELFDFVLLDLGVSSPQLDSAERGFSFYNDGPLDMRMDRTQDLTAADVLNTYDEEDLISIFKIYGEIFKPYRLVRAVVHDRKSKPFRTTRDLAGLVERVEGWRKKGIHPATQFFMALRIEVNSELKQIEDSLPIFAEHLSPGGRLAVISFHSLEDRIVKNFMRSSDLGKSVHKKVIVASDEEVNSNPRSRSAKFRVFARATDLPPRR